MADPRYTDKQTALLCATEAVSTYDDTPEEAAHKVLTAASAFHDWLLYNRMPRKPEGKCSCGWLPVDTLAAKAGTEFVRGHNDPACPVHPATFGPGNPPPEDL